MKIKAKKTFTPLQWQIEPWRDKSPVILLTGSAGGGKSHIAFEKANGYALKYPGAFILLLRKTRVSMTSGAALFFQEEIVISRENDPHNGVRHVESKSRFEYANGSIVAYMGLQDNRDREKLKSIGRQGGVDLTVMEEATEFEEADYNAVLARMRGRAADWRQIILACNPDSPTHWIYTRLIQGEESKIYYSSANDNNYNPADYLKTLARMTGVDKMRLAEGMWVQASGLVYEMWRDHPGKLVELMDENEVGTGVYDEGNVTELADYVPNGGPIFWACDDGYSAGSKFGNGIDPISKTYTADAHPRVIMLFQMKADGHLDLFEESYACKTLSEVQIREVFELGYPLPEFASVDSSAAELRGRFHTEATYKNDEGLTIKRPAIYTQGATHTVDEGIKVMRQWLEADENGFRRFRCHPRIRHFRREMVSYSYNQQTEKPFKTFDHGPDTVRYKIWKLRHGI